MKIINEITAVGTGKKNAGSVFRTFKDRNGCYNLFEQGNNKTCGRIQTENFDHTYSLMNKGYKIRLKSDDDGTTAQRMIESCVVEFK